jgi:hypothetical protein
MYTPTASMDPPQTGTAWSLTATRRSQGANGEGGWSLTIPRKEIVI